MWVFDRPSGSPSSINIDAEFESGTYEGPFSVWKEGQCNVVRSTRNPVSSSPYKVEFTYQFIGSGSDCKVNRKYQIGFANIHFKSGKGLTKSFKINGVEQCGNGVVPTDVTKTTKVTETTIATEVTDATEATEATETTIATEATETTKTTQATETTEAIETTQNPSGCTTKHPYEKVETFEMKYSFNFNFIPLKRIIPFLNDIVTITNLD